MSHTLVQSWMNERKNHNYVQTAVLQWYFMTVDPSCNVLSDQFKHLKKLYTVNLKIFTVEKYLANLCVLCIRKNIFPKN